MRCCASRFYHSPSCCDRTIKPPADQRREDALFVDNIVYAKSCRTRDCCNARTNHLLAVLNGNLHSIHSTRISITSPGKSAFAAFNGEAKPYSCLRRPRSRNERSIEIQIGQSVDSSALDPELTRALAVPRSGINKSFDDLCARDKSDAFVWLDDLKIEPFDIAVVDFPPAHSLWQTYTRASTVVKTKPNPIVRRGQTTLHHRATIVLVLFNTPSIGLYSQPYQQPSRLRVWGLRFELTLRTPTKPASGVDLQFLTSDLCPMSSFADTMRPTVNESSPRYPSIVRYYDASARLSSESYRARITHTFSALRCAARSFNAPRHFPTARSLGRMSSSGMF